MVTERIEATPVPSADHSEVLKNLGIDVWRLRRVQPAAEHDPALGAHHPEAGQADSSSVGMPSSEPIPAGARPGNVPAAVSTLRQSLAAVGRAEPQVRNEEQVRSSGAPPAVEPALPAGGSVAEDQTSFTVLSLAVQARLLLIECGRPADVRRLAADILASSAASWPARTSELVFEWTPGSERGGKLSATRALGAFAGKQIDDAGSDATVLICERVAARLPELFQPDAPAGRLVRIPPADVLLGDADSKKRLWLDLQARVPRTSPS